ncbi:MAG TPA: sensor histidine kinase [Acidimicrobiales bacterium]|nr:sensor histidine kinase [Acidimicrobiales bacterium]
MARPTSNRFPRSTPVALLYVGLPAYLAIVGFSARDLFDSHSTAVALAGVAAIAMFTAAFFLLTFSYRLDVRSYHAAIAVMGVLSVVLALLGVTAAVYVAAVAAMAGEGLPPRQSVPIILTGSAIVVISATANHFAPSEIFTQGIIVFVVGLFTFGLRRLSEANRQLMAAREEVARLAVLDERVRFARDLHDLLGHSLTVIRAKSELASRLAPADMERAVQEMTEVERLAREALVEVRETVTGYRRPNLAAELTNARVALDAAGIEAEVHADVDDVPDDLDETLAWVLREMVTNVVRHSHARSCRIEASGDRGAISLAVTDDGHGPSGTVGNGLAGARERLALVGGTLELDSGPDGGFHARARVAR